MKIKLFLSAMALSVLSLTASATTPKQTILVNDEVTTHIVMPEDIKMVDLSTTKIIGNQCADNIVRIKPFIESDPEAEPTSYSEGELMGTLTLIGERHLTQYDILYTKKPTRAASIHQVNYGALESYINPEVSMPKSEMARYAWAVYGSDRKFNQLVFRSNGMKAIINNIYSIGDYFFIDYSLQNKTKIAYDIEELRVKLTDKKEVKATNSQTIELTPAYSLNLAKKIQKELSQRTCDSEAHFP